MPTTAAPASTAIVAEMARQVEVRKTTSEPSAYPTPVQAIEFAKDVSAVLGALTSK